MFIWSGFCINALTYCLPMNVTLCSWYWPKGVYWEIPVLKINNHATGGWRTKDILRGPKSLETKKLGSSKGWGDQSAKKTNNWRDKKYLMNRWGTKKLRTYVVGWFCWNLRAFWEDQTDQKSAVGGPKRISRTGVKASTCCSSNCTDMGRAGCSTTPWVIDTWGSGGLGCSRALAPSSGATYNEFFFMTRIS